MMSALTLLALAAQAAPAAPPPLQTLADRYDHCVALATGADPARGAADAADWQRTGGKYFARQCLAIAFANQGRWQDAAMEFSGAADDAEVAHDIRAARYWAQAGNAWLAANNPAKARSALDAALGAGTLDGDERGEATFDRARALVALDAMAPARIDMDAALAVTTKDPLIWLASATLARKMHDFPRAKHDAVEAYRLAPDDASVNLEIGNIAAASGDAEGARMAWSDAARIGGDTPVGRNARDALKQFDTADKPAAAAPQ